MCVLVYHLLHPASPTVTNCWTSCYQCDSHVISLCYRYVTSNRVNKSFYIFCIIFSFSFAKRQCLIGFKTSCVWLCLNLEINCVRLKINVITSNCSHCSFVVHFSCIHLVLYFVSVVEVNFLVDERRKWFK